MKLFIDDWRPCPAGWVLAKDYDEAVEILASCLVTDVSFDHDLGCDGFDDGGNLIMKKSGYDVASWLEKRVATDATFPVPDMQVHSANPAGIRDLNLVIGSILRFAAQR